MIQSIITRSKYNSPVVNKQTTGLIYYKKLEETFGGRLSKQRRLKGLTQKKLAEIIGVGSVSVNKYESNKTFPEAPKLVSLAKALGCSIDYLMRGVTARPPESNEIIEVLKDNIKAKDTIIYKQEEEIVVLKDEVKQYQKKGQQKELGNCNSA